MSSLVSIQGKSTQIVSFKGQNVLTTKQIAEFYEADPIAITKNFNNNKDKYQEGKHYFKLQNGELKEFLKKESPDLCMQNLDTQNSSMTKINETTFFD